MSKQHTVNLTKTSAQKLSRLVSTMLVIFFVTALIMLAGGYPASMRQAQAQEGNDDAIAQIDQYLTEQAEANAFSGSVLIANGNEVLLSKGYGMANLELGVGNTPQTVFQIGGLTLQFTAMGILLLQEQGALSVDDQICQYLDDCPDAWQEITIRHLLTHTSGIPDYVAFPDFRETQTLATTPEDILERFIQEPLSFLPGDRWEYSSSGYIVLGLIIEEVSGERYRIFLRDHFFEPLGMSATDLYGNNEIVDNRAEGYVNQFSRAPYIDISVEYAAGALSSSVEDLLTWNQALFSGNVVSQDSLDDMMADTVTINDNLSYGYGLFVSSSFVGHYGQTSGFVSNMRYLQGSDITIIILSNFETTDAFELSRIIEEILTEQN